MHNWKVIEVKIKEKYTIHLTFLDGTTGEIDLEPLLYGEIFIPLKDPKYFQQLQIVGSSIGWPNGADFAPEFLYKEVKNSRQP
ncbi:MAG: DUF2442 domain-containing protein [Verrucomicrobiota bacterium]